MVNMTIVRNLGIFWLFITPIALLFGAASGLIDGAGKSIWFGAARGLWMFAGVIYLVCGFAAISLYRDGEYKRGVIFAVLPFYVLTLHIATVIIYW